MDAFDYIIVGAGTAGCVVANRLSASGRHKVLLLEAGGSDRRFWVQLPIGYGRTFNNPQVNWMYEAEPDPGLAARRLFWPRGKVLGGSGSINAMVYYRGLPADFDDWRALGNPGWGFDDVLPVFQRFEERGQSAAPRGAPLIHISDVSEDVHPLCQKFLDTCRALGLAAQDFNGAQGEGVGIYQITTQRGRRASTAGSYLHPAMSRANLTLRLRAQVLRIRFEQRRAVGVTYRHGERTLAAQARRAVILCGGAINSPQLLQLSGVGDGAVLARHGIAVVAESPAVGRNLQDHVAVSHFYRSRVPTLNDVFVPLSGKLKIALRYLVSRRGPLAMSVNQAGGFVKGDAARSRPNLQLYFNPVSYTAQGRERRLLQPDPFSAFILSFNACRPTSRGYVEIRSANPFEAPLIQPNSLSTDQDVAAAIAGARLLRTIAGTAPLVQYVESEMLPGSDQQSDAQLLQDFRERAGTVFHPVSTCRMGPDPATAVVDATLRVYGVEALRVIDASIFPTVTSGNTNAPTIMVAEKGAALLAADEGS
ncbi:MAG TPA: GMC family oxidoreductase N-terminal domain-containing protein [Steroidobacteraceae bacterium]|nr:GMC family oxidoreductase N-terminal domain-containing protein [Steroidobacteraceae bacterium]